jgi:copper(I)-binding protein
MKLTIQSLLALVLLMLSSLSLAAGITIEDPYVRAIPPGSTISASFLTLKNTSDKDIALVKAVSDIAENVELHEHVHENGMMKMRQVPRINIAAKSETALKPGGYHIMLIGLKKTIQPGDIIDMTLEFDNGDKQAIKAEVKKIAMGMMKKGGMKGMAMKGDMKGKKGDMQAKMKAMKHVNPMPSLMKVVMKMGDKLNLSDEQSAKLKAWHDERKPVIMELLNLIPKLEAELHQAALDDAPLSKIDQLSHDIMQNRIKLIRNKAFCRENMKDILSEEQYKKVIELYKANFMSPAMSPAK